MVGAWICNFAPAQTWEGLILGAFQVHPVLPALGGALQVVQQPRVLLNLLQLLILASYLGQHLPGPWRRS